MEYSDEQVQLLRERLSYYYHDEGGRKGMPWSKLSRNIEEKTGVNIPQESLRQFVEPSNKKEGKKPRRLKPPSRLDAVRDFLCHSSISYLEKHELDEQSTPYATAYSLSKFLEKPNSSSPTESLPNMRGEFQSVTTNDTLEEKKELYISINDNSGLIKVREISTLSNMKREEDDDIEELDQVHYSGWAVRQNEGVLIFFLADPMTKQAYSYFSLIASPTIKPSQNINQLILYQYRRPLEMDLKELISEDGDLQPQGEALVNDLMQDNVYLFMRRAIKD